jgi:hypothetical protein
MADQLQQLLYGLESTGGIALLSRGTVAPWLVRELQAAWRAAHQDAVDAYRVWRGSGGGELYAAYRAAQDRADAAQDALALSAAGVER